MLDTSRLRRDFPVLGKEFPNGPLVYFDNACTTLKPRSVIEATREYYEDYPVCGERSLHALGREVTQRVDESRGRVARFVKARAPEEIVFTKNATEALNLVANGLDWKKGDVVITTDKEHSSNWVPWLELASSRGIRHMVVESEKDGRFNLGRFEAAVESAGDRLRLVSLVHASNIDGVTLPLKRISAIAHKAGALVAADAAQSAPHHPLDVTDLGVDFVAVSAHKMLGPSGLGFLYGKREALEQLRPYMLGGGTVKRSDRTGYEWQDLPNRFEAGLQNFAGIVAFPAALDYLEGVGLGNIEAHERALNEQATKRLAGIPGVEVYGPSAGDRSGIVPFNLGWLSPHDVAAYLDESRNVAIRSGAMCVYSYLAARGLDGWARASFYLYNTMEEVDAFADAVAELATSVKERQAATAKAL